MKQTKRWWDWQASLIVVFLVGVVAARLSVTNWSPNLWMMDILAFFGVLLGLLMGASRYRLRTIFLFSIVFTLFFVIWQLGLTLDPQEAWLARLAGMFDQIIKNLSLFFNNTPVTDPLLFLTLMGILVWTLALIAGFRVARYGSPWWPLMGLAVLLIIVDYYNPFLLQRNRYLGIFFFLMLLLLGRLFFLRMRKKWAETYVMEDSEVGMNFTRWAIGLSLVIVMVAWSFPILLQALTLGSPIQRRWERTWESWRDRLSNAVAGLTNPGVPVSNFYGNTISLGTRASSGDESIFTIKVLGEPTAYEGRLYWRSRSYDNYSDSGWKSSFTDIQINPANDWQINTKKFENQAGISFAVRNELPLSRMIVSPGTPINFSRPIQAQIAAADESEMDLMGLLAEPPLGAGEIYQVQVRLPQPTIEQMQGSSLFYPSWVKERYLVLPEDFSQRIRDLAIQITLGLTNPYDKAEAITRYLRRTITYVDEVAPPPFGADAMEWFLFDSKKGFCNYYASAEVLMLRAVGVPARLSVGFAEGEYMQTTAQYVVRQKDNHAWPEVYFSGIGWVEFEPTVIIPERIFPEAQPKPGDESAGSFTPPHITLDEGAIPEDVAGQTEETPVPPGDVHHFGTTVAWILVIFFAIAIPSVFFLRFLPRPGEGSIWRKWEKQLQDQGRKVPDWLKYLARDRNLYQLQRILRWINRILTWMGNKPSTGLTVAERVSLLIQCLPGAKTPGLIFLEQYELAEYSTHTADLIAAIRAGRQIIREYFDYSVEHLFRK